MGILLPRDVDWSPSNWAGRALFDGLLEQHGLPSKLEAGLRFCIDAEVDTLDLRQATLDELQELRSLVQVVLDRAIAAGPASFQLPEFHPGYVAKLNLLVEQLDGLLASG